MIIRKATLDDLDQIEIIENECFVDPYKREDLIYELTTNPCSTVLVAIIDDKIVGFIDYMITFTSSTISQIAILLVLDHQNESSPYSKSDTAHGPFRQSLPHHLFGQFPKLCKSPWHDPVLLDILFLRFSFLLQFAK